MNRRDLLKCLAGVVPAAAVKTIQAPSQEDVIVVECKEFLSAESIDRIAEAVRVAFGPMQRVIVVDSGMTVKTVPIRQAQMSRKYPA